VRRDTVEATVAIAHSIVSLSNAIKSLSLVAISIYTGPECSSLADTPNMGGSLNPSVQTTSIRGLTFVDMLDLEAQNKRERGTCLPELMGMRRD